MREKCKYFSVSSSPLPLSPIRFSYHIPARPSFICTCFSLLAVHAGAAPSSLRVCSEHIGVCWFLLLTDASNLDSTVTMLILSNDWTLQDKGDRALTATTQSKKEPPLLLAWFKSCSLIKLFKTCSRHFNTPVHFEADWLFSGTERQRKRKRAYYHNNSNALFRGAVWKIHEEPTCLKWNHNLL